MQATRSFVVRQVFRHPLYFIAFGFGSGLLPFFPGTWGTLMAIPFYLLLIQLPWQLYLSVVLLAFVVGIWMCDLVQDMTQSSDYSGIVWDEFVGYWITMFLAPTGWRWMIIGFILFRFFDILKPWPIRWVDSQMKSGVGIMLDDFLAGLFAFLVLQLLAHAVLGLQYH